MAQGPLLGILHCQNPGRRSVQPSQPPSPGLGDNMLPDFCVAALWSNTFILITSILGSTHCLPAFPALPQHRGSAQDAGTCTAAPLPPLSCALHPRSPGDGGPGLCSTAAVPRSQETASINHWHIHPSPDPEMAIPRLGLSPGNPVVSCRVGWEGRGRQGERDMQQGSRGARHGGLAGRGSGTAMGTLAPATHTVGYFKVCHVRAASVPLWANL